MINEGKEINEQVDYRVAVIVIWIGFYLREIYLNWYRLLLPMNDTTESKFSALLIGLPLMLPLISTSVQAQGGYIRACHQLSQMAIAAK
jgi:hypothetical protein